MPTKIKKISHTVIAVLVIAIFVGVAMLAINASAADKKDDSKSMKSAMLADKHAAKGVTCADCHGTDKAKGQPDMATCTKCHGGNKKMMEQTKNLKPNPHDAWHLGLGEIRCTLCHHGHKASELYCNSCHAPHNPMDPKPIK